MRWWIAAAVVWLFAAGSQTVLAQSCGPACHAPGVQPVSRVDPWYGVGRYSYAPQPVLGGYGVPAQPVVNPYQAYRPTLPPGAPYYFGRGLIGQPKVYVSGQPLRNLLRYLSP